MDRCHHLLVEGVGCRASVWHKSIPIPGTTQARPTNVKHLYGDNKLGGVGPSLQVLVAGLQARHQHQIPYQSRN